MRVGLIAAIAENGVIGIKNRLPWHLPADLKLFRIITTGHAVIMGRRTAESIARPLPNRRNVVVTSQNQIEGFKDLCSSLDQALNLLRPSFERVFIIGGFAMFQEALSRNLVDELHCTQVHAQVDGDTYFPRVDWQIFELVEEVYLPADDAHVYASTYRRYHKKID